MEVENSVEFETQSLKNLMSRNKKRTRDLFKPNYGVTTPPPEDLKSSLTLKLQAKVTSEYNHVKDLPPVLPNANAIVASTTTTTKATTGSGTQAITTVQITADSTGGGGGGGKKDQQQQKQVTFVGSNAYPARPGVTISEEDVNRQREEEEDIVNSELTQEILRSIPEKKAKTEISLTPSSTSHGIVAYQNTAGLAERIQPPSKSKALTVRSTAFEKPQWHAPWKLMRVISGHLGWVKCVAVDSSNEWFATGSADRTIKIWDLASGVLKLTLTGHINTVRGLAVSPRHPYLFSAAEDKMVKCWDLEQNKVVRHYHGHLSGVYSLALHPTLDVLVTGGRDSTARVWDMRTKQCIHVLTGHTNTVGSVVCQATEPQVITGSQDSTIRLWDLAKGTAYATLTHHKKSIRSMALHPTEYSMASGAPDNIKIWKFPEGKFMRNLSGHNSIINTLAINSDDVLVSGADNGSVYFWDWKTGYNFQKIQTAVQPGSLESEAGIFGLAFDQTGSRLISCEADKTIKIYKEDETQTPETFPIENWPPKPTKNW